MNESRWKVDPAVLYGPVGGVYCVCEHSGVSQAVFMCIDEIKLLLPRPGLAGPVGERSRCTPIHHAVTRRLARGTCSMLLGVLWTPDLTDRQPDAGSRGAAWAALKTTKTKQINRLNWSMRKTKTCADLGGVVGSA